MMTPEELRALGEDICWHSEAGIKHCPCPARSLGYGERDLIWWGRCQSGRRWFWATTVLTYSDSDARREHGWADTEDQASCAARASVVTLAAGRPAIASVRHGHASDRLKEINAEKRRNRPSNGGTDTGSVEYLYGDNSHHWDGNQCGCDDLEGQAKQNYHIVRFQITKKTAKRIYYIRRGFGFADPEIGYVSRQELEANGEVRNRGVHWSSTDRLLYAEPPDINLWEPPTPDELRADISRLRADMADAHPDRGGSNAEFIAAHQRYQQARRTGAP